MAGSELTQHLLVAVAAIVLAALAGGKAARRLGQPPVLGEIVAGIALGPSLLGAVWPAASEALFPAELIPFLQPVGQLGLTLFMFLIGLQLDQGHLRGQGHRAVLISHTSILVPLGLGAGLAVWLHPRVGGDVDLLPFALFVGAAMAVTAFPVLARILQETGLHRTPVGAMALACAAVDDVTAWCVLAVVLAVASGSGLGSALVTAAATIAFCLVLWLVVRPLLARLAEVPMALALGVALGSAWITEAIGVHFIFGAFLAGVVMPQGAGVRLVLTDRIDALTSTLLLPVFFMLVGLSTELGVVDTPALWGTTLLIIAVATVGKLGGAGLAARLVGESWRSSMAIGVLMNTRGLTEIVILTVGLERGIIGPTVFTMMVLMALATTVVAVPVLRRLEPDGFEPVRGSRRAVAGPGPA